MAHVQAGREIEEELVRLCVDERPSVADLREVDVEFGIERPRSSAL